MSINLRELRHALKAAAVVAKKDTGRATVTSDGQTVRVSVSPGPDAKPNRMDLCVSTVIDCGDDVAPLKSGEWDVDISRALDVLDAIDSPCIKWEYQPLRLYVDRARLMLATSIGSVEIGEPTSGAKKPRQLPSDVVPDSVPAVAFTGADCMGIARVIHLAAPWNSDRAQQLACVEIETVDGVTYASATDGRAGASVKLPDVIEPIDDPPMWLHRSAMKYIARSMVAAPFTVRRGPHHTRLDVGGTSWAWRHGAPARFAWNVSRMCKPAVAIIHVSNDSRGALIGALNAAAASHECAVVLRSDVPGKLVITTHGISIGRTVDMQIDGLTINGEMPAVCVSPELLRSVMAACHHVERIEIAGPLNPVRVVGPDGIVGVVMPMRL